MSLLSRHILIVTGKGGVGKSTLAAALALRATKEKKKVLLVELGEESFYKQFFGLPEVNHIPQPVPGMGFELALWDTESCLREYVLYYIKIQGLFRLFFENRVMRAFINVAPALKELAILGKLTSGERHIGPEFKYDLVVVDSYATGHTLSLLRAPKGMSESVRTGPMGEHSAGILRVLKNPDITSYVVVTLPEELPVVEALELQKTLKEEFSVTPEIVVNRLLRPPLTDQELGELRDQSEAATGPGAFVRFLLSQKARQESALRRLRSEGAHVYEVPLMYGTNSGIGLVSEIAGALIE